jgi:hypothetical protein
MGKRHSGIRLEHLAPAARAQVLQLMNPVQAPSASEPGEVAAVKKRIRQSREPILNKLETSYRDEVLFKRYTPTQVRSQDLRLRLGNGTWYKPDFHIPHERLIVEVKGPKAWRGGLEFLKVAASVHPYLRFVLVWRESRLGPWLWQEVLP